jgi:hypothetical protein
MYDEETRAGGVGRGGAGAMHKRRTTLEDGRYMIYYTFGDEADSSSVEGAGGKARPEPEAATVEEEERSV